MARSLLAKIFLRAEAAPEVTGACCILHNVCDTLEEEEEEEEEGLSHDDNSDEVDAGELEIACQRL
ncbi:hypothetical protein NQZ68_012180, partial [Dissostichus eleginoides]